MAPSKEKTGKPGNENITQILRLSPKAAAKVQKIPRGQKSYVISKLLEETSVAKFKELQAS